MQLPPAVEALLADGRSHEVTHTCGRRFEDGPDEGEHWYVDGEEVT